MLDRTRLRTTWDGLFISEEPPHGATVLVRRRTDTGDSEFLILHRTGASTDCDWAWGPPATTRLPGEDVAACARRELDERTGLRLPLNRLGTDDDWATYSAEALANASIALSADYDEYAWVTADEARRRCQPAIVGDQFAGLAAAAAA